MTRIIADTNILVRVMVEDNPRQARLARAALLAASRIVIPTPVFCELVWVLARGYDKSTGDIADAIRRLLATAKLDADRAAVAFGLAILDAGGDFADGAIAYDGAKAGGEVFMSFDKDAVRIISAAGMKAQQPH